MQPSKNKSFADTGKIAREVCIYPGRVPAIVLLFGIILTKMMI